MKIIMKSGKEFLSNKKAEHFKGEIESTEKKSGMGRIEFETINHGTVTIKPSDIEAICEK